MDAATVQDHGRRYPPFCSYKREEMPRGSPQENEACIEVLHTCVCRLPCHLTVHPQHKSSSIAPYMAEARLILLSGKASRGLIPSAFVYFSSDLKDLLSKYFKAE